MIEPPIVGQLRAMGHTVFLTGSRAIVPDLVADDKDQDWVVWLRDKDHVMNMSYARRAIDWIEAAGFHKEGAPNKYGPDEGFESYRNGLVNLLVVISPGTAVKWRDATRLARALRLNERKDRVTLFEAILYDEFPLYPDGLGWDTTPDEVANGD